MTFKKNNTDMYKRFEEFEEGYQLDFQQVAHATWDAQEGGQFLSSGDKIVLPGCGWFGGVEQVWHKTPKLGLVPEEAKQKFCPFRNGNCITEGCMAWVGLEDGSGRCGMIK